MGRREDADIDLDVLAVPQPADRLLLEHAEQLHLQRERQLADLVEQQRAVVRLLEQACACRSPRR